MANLTLRPNKCEFAKPEIIYLGHFISRERIKVDPSKIEAVKSLPIPQNQHDIRSFLGLNGYYRKYVKVYAKIVAPLNLLLPKDISFKWTSDCENAFKTLKQALLTAPVLGYPNLNKPFILACDVSGSAIGYILSQLGDDNKEHVIGHGGRALIYTEPNYSVTEQKLLALVSAISYFHIYLANSTFDVYTDHKALTWLNSIKHTNSRLIRWALKLQEYKFKVLHRPGKRNQHCDALSRRDYQNNNTNNVSSPNKELFEVTFVYANENDIPQLFNSQSFTNVCALEKNSELQKQCPYFGPIYEFLKNGILPADKRRARAIPYESIQYEIINDAFIIFSNQELIRKLIKKN